MANIQPELDDIPQWSKIVPLKMPIGKKALIVENQLTFAYSHSLSKALNIPSILRDRQNYSRRKTSLDLIQSTKQDT
jgi:hypothetical protein